MGRSAVRRVNRPRNRAALDVVIIAAGIIILAFAVVGVVATGLYVGAGSAKPAPHRVLVPPQEVARARAQATSIVKAARGRAQALLAAETTRARKRARRILTTARHRAQEQAAAVSAAANTGASAPVSPSSTSSSAPAQPAANSTTSSTVNSGPTTSAAPPTNASTPPMPDLSNVPSSWLVVAYNASFGSGPGSAGGVSIVNRAQGPMSGVVKVEYLQAGRVIGSAAAPFDGVSPGVHTIPLNGMAYPGGSVTYRITMQDVH